jgi:hypothetical protein
MLTATNMPLLLQSIHTLTLLLPLPPLTCFQGPHSTCQLRLGRNWCAGAEEHRQQQQRSAVQQVAAERPGGK